MSDYISRQAAVIEMMDNNVDHAQGTDGREVIQILEDIPAADVVPVVHAHWKDNKNGTVSCSRCSTWFQKERVPYLRFCGYCGAKMDGERKE